MRPHHQKPEAEGSKLHTKHNEMRQAALLELYEMQDLPLSALADFVLEKSLPLTASTIGFFGFINKDQSVMTIHAWSKEAMQKCGISDKPLEFAVQKAGVWGDAVRSKQPVIINDFMDTHAPHRPLPEGHVPISRFMIVPLLEDGKVVVVSAVGNKIEQYGDADVAQLQLLLRGMWQIVSKKKAEKQLLQEHEALEHVNERLKKVIADRQAAEQALRESEIKFRTVADFTFDWEYWINSDGTYEYISPSCERITGISPQELMDDPDLLKTIIHPEDLALLERHFTEDIMRDAPCHLDFRICSRDGEQRWISHLCQPVYDGEGNFLGRRASNRDISKRKQTESTLIQERQELEKRVEERTEDLTQANIQLKKEIARHKQTYEAFKLTRFSIDHANDLLYWLDSEGNIADVNESTCKRLGYTKEELLSMNVADVDPDYTKEEYQDVWEKLRKQGVWVIKTHHISKSGESIPVEIHLNYINFNGQEYNCAFARDISEHKELERLVSIEDKMGSLGRVAAGIAHEIRNPLSTINIHLSSLKSVVASETDEQDKSFSSLDEIIREMESASKKINSVVKRVIDFSRPTTQHRKWRDINACVSNPYDLSTATFRKSGIEASLILSEDLPSTYCDCQSIEQVVLNLLTNAIEELKESSGNKELEVRTGHETKRGKKIITISVADSGRGVALHENEKIFDPFFTTKHYGSGIGLSICHRIIRDHQGTIDVGCGKLGGAEFLITLPVQEEEHNT